MVKSELLIENLATRIGEYDHNDSIRNVITIIINRNHQFIAVLLQMAVTKPPSGRLLPLFLSEAEG